ncbi:MAG: FAD-dependent oxidoreductase, partial [Calditrichia bacterium]
MEKIKNVAKIENNTGNIGSALVLGGGIGGMQTALDLAESGIKVYLVEKKPCIGGIMSQLDKTFPTNDCSMCIMAPKLVEIGRHKDITIITLADIEQVDGEAGNFKVTLKQNARYIDEEKCTGCSECEEKCPIIIPSEFNMGLDEQKAIYRLYPQAIPNTFAIMKLGQSPCRYTCPAGQRAQGYIALIKEKRFEDAFNVIIRDNPLPSVCGRICKHYCEDECTRKEVDDPLSIMNLKRFISDWAYENKIKPAKKEKPVPEKPGRIAIIGSGPAGLTAACDLSHIGHTVTIFEALPELGGMVRYGVPDFRLSMDKVRWDIGNILADDSIEVKTNTRIKSLDAVLKEGFNAVFVAVGAQIGKKLPLPGNDLPDVLINTDFLRKIAMGEKIKVKKRVLVLGSGNVAMDVARAALRVGAENVRIACLEVYEAIPADPQEVEDARKEGIEILTCRTFTEITSKNGKVTGIKSIAVMFRGFDKNGKPDKEIIEGSEHVIEADTIIFAIGQAPEVPFADEGIELTKSGTIKVDEDTMATSKQGVFAGGDAVTGTKFIVDAIGAGHQAAKSIDAYLQGKEIEKTEENKVELTDEEIQQRLKSNEKKKDSLGLQVEKLKKAYKPTEQTFTEEEAIVEASRCLECAICSECLMCMEACKADGIEHVMPKEKFIDLNVGAIVLAPGNNIFDANKKQELGYDRYPNVVTALEFERILSATGPYSGKVRRPSDSNLPKKIAFIQCVGSREVDRNYCSSACCMFATKESIIAMEHEQEVECTIFFIDMRAFGKGFDAYYERAKELGVNYIRCRPSSIKEIPGTKNLKIQYQSEDGDIKVDEFDLVVLSTGFEPPEEVAGLSKKLGFKLNEFDFCETSNFKPVETSREGVYACGPFTEPKDIPETVMQSSGAASKALSLLSDVRGSLIKPMEYPPEIDVTGEDPRIGIFIC